MESATLASQGGLLRCWNLEVCHIYYQSNVSPHHSRKVHLGDCQHPAPVNAENEGLQQVQAVVVVVFADDKRQAPRGGWFAPPAVHLGVAALVQIGHME